MKEIKAVMENPALDRNHILKMQREMLLTKIKRLDAVLEKLADRREYSVDSFEVKEIVGEYGFVMKQLCQLKEEKGMMLSLAETYRREEVKTAADEKYGDGFSQFFLQAIEAFYK